MNNRQEPNSDAVAAEAPKKPIEKKTIAYVLVGLFVVAVSLISLASAFVGSQPKTASTTDNQTPTAKPAVRDFAKDVDQAGQVLKQNAESASKVAKIAATLHAQLPPCNDETRAQLAGRYYTIQSTTAGMPDANLLCQPDNQWALVPPSVGQVQTETPAQQAAEQRSSNTGTMTPAEKRKARIAQVYQSSLIPMHFADAVEEKPAAAGSTVTPTAPVNTPVPTSSFSPVKPTPSEDADTETTGAPSREKQQLGVQLSSYNGPRYPLFQGQYIEGLLVNRLSGDLGGGVKVQITTPFYSHDKQHLLISPGSVLLGEAARVKGANEDRLAVVFHRIIMPDGWSFMLEPTHGLDQQGAEGLVGKINHHLAALIATAVMVGAIEGLSDFTDVGGSGSSIIEIQSGISHESSTQAMQILRGALNRPPGITVFEGTRVRVWVAQDTALPSYENHVVKTTVE